MILSGGYLLSGIFVTEPDWYQYWVQFLNVHVLLFGGATAYNSWWDKDEGPIGGLKSPPKMEQWMWPASLVIQFAGLFWAISISGLYAAVYAVSMLFFWLYSTPLFRWKGKPILSLVAIAVSTGTNSFLMGFIAAGGTAIGLFELSLAVGVALVLLSLYPVSQVFQTDEDAKRGDQTFAVCYGLRGVKWLFTLLFPLGAGLLAYGFFHQIFTLGLLFTGVNLIAYAGLSWFVWNLKGNSEEYSTVMKIKFVASFSFGLFILAVIAVRNLG